MMLISEYTHGLIVGMLAGLSLAAVIQIVVFVFFRRFK
jgi:hypothetical protein